MVGQISIFDLMASDIDVWENFRDNYCKKQAALFPFDEMGKKKKEGKLQKACCLRDKAIKEPFDNWQRCTYNNCPFLKGERRC